MKRILPIILLLAMIPFSVQAIDIDSCRFLNSSGTYVLTQDVSTNGDCMTINASNIDLDLGGYTISGDGGLDDDGIVLGDDNSANGFNVTNGVINNFYNGISSVDIASNIEITDIIINHTGNYDFIIDINTDGITIENLTTQNSQSGFSIFTSGTNVDNFVMNNSNIEGVVSTDGCALQSCAGWVIENSVLSNDLRADSVHLFIKDNSISELNVFDGSKTIYTDNVHDWSEGIFWTSGSSFVNWVNYTNQSSSGIWINTSCYDNSNRRETDREIITYTSSEIEFNQTFSGDISEAMYISGLDASTTFTITNNSYSYGSETTDGSGNLPALTFNFPSSGEYSILIAQNQAPSIDSNSTNMTARYGETVKITSEVTDPNGAGDIAFVTFSVFYPNGTALIDNVTGNNPSGDTYDSGDLTPTEYGTWLWYVNATDAAGSTDSTWGSFDITLGTLSVFSPDSDTNHTMTVGRSETAEFYIILNHTGNSNNTVSVTETGDYSDTTIFEYWNVSSTNFNVGYGSDYNLTVNLTANGSAPSGLYNITLNFTRTDDNSITIFYLNVTVAYGVPDIVQTGFTINVVTSGTVTSDFQFNNTGNYENSNCNLTFSSTLGTGSWNVSSFAVSPSIPVDGQLSITAGGTSGSDTAATVLLNCSIYTDGSYATDTITGTLTVTSNETGGGDGGGGGGGGGTTIIYQIVNLTDFNVSVSPERMSRLYRPGAVFLEPLQVLNSNDQRITVTARITCADADSNETEDPSCGWARFDVNGSKRDSLDVTLDPGVGIFPSRKTIFVSVEVPENVSFEDYKFFVQLSQGSAATNVPFELKTSIGFFPWYLLWFQIGPDFANEIPVLGDSLKLWHFLVVGIVIVVLAKIVTGRRKKRRR